MEPVRNTVSQENVITRDFVIIRDAVDSQEILLHHFINPQPLTLKGICQHNKAILHIYTGKNPNKIDTYRATRAKNGGCALGAIHEQTTLKTYRSAREWLGKVGAPKGLLRHNTDTYCTRTEKEINIDTIREKLAYDLYKELGRGYFEVPRTRLARQPFVDEFMPSSMSLTMFMIVNRDVIQDTLRIMSRLVDGYSDFKHAKVLDSNQQSIPFLEFIKTYHRPPEELLTAEGKTVPLYGFMEMIAVARILGDTDALGGTADNAGFVWIKENDEIVGAQTYKIDPGCAFCFTHDESDSSPSPSWVINKIKGLAGKCVSDHRDFQTAQNYFPSVIEWEALTIQQQETFLGILFNSSRYLSSNVLGFLFHRNGAFFLDEKAYLPKDIADQFQNEFKEWLTIQFTIYDEELHAFHAKYPEQALRAYYIDACGEITLPMKNQSFPIGELFTDLALISKKQTIHLLPEVDSLKATKVEGMASSELVDLSNIFDQNRTVLLLGRAGIGKSSLCQKIAHSWASGELWNDRFDLLFWLPLNLLNELSVGDNANHFLTEIVLPYLFKQLPGFSHLNIEKKRVLFVLDGYDEASKELANRVESLLTDTPYSFFIASRPEKIHLCVDQTIENMGFSEQRIEEYIQKFSECQGAKQNHTLYNLIKKNPCLESIAHVPLLLQMVVSLYDKKINKANFATLTNLYAKMVDALYEWNLPNDPQKEENLLYLAKIASVGFKSGKLLISPKMISRPIDRELLRTGLLKESEKTGSLYFVHLSFQEYLTALYISRSTPEKQRGFIDKWRYESSHQLVLSFLAGLMHAQGKAGDFFETFCKKSNNKALLPSYQLESLLRFLNECQGLTAEISAITNLLDDFVYQEERPMWNILLDDGYPLLLSALHQHQINALKWLILNVDGSLEQTTQRDKTTPWEERTHYYISQGKTKTLPYEGSLYTLLAKNDMLPLLNWLQENYDAAIKKHAKEILYVALHENKPSIFQQLLVFIPNLIFEASQPENQSILFKYAVSANEATLQWLLSHLNAEAAKEFARYAIRRNSKAVEHLLRDAKLIPHRQEMVVYAIENEKLESLKAILKLDPSLINHKDQEGKTLLFLAAAQGNARMVEYILSQSTDLMSILTQEGYSPYHAAAANGNTTILEVLFRAVPLARSQMRCPAHNGWTPLHFAAQQGNLQAIEWLVQNCDDLLNAVNSDNETALDIAYYEKRTEVVDWLKANGGKSQKNCLVM